MRFTGPQVARAATPLISVVMANYQAGAKLIPAIQSVLGQTERSLELLVCDDASADNSIAIVQRFMRDDARISLIVAEANGGPARSRNRGLQAARGQWIAVVDSDDIIHPERFERLLAAADHHGAGVIADDLLHFYEDGSPTSLLLGRGENKLFSVGATQWISAGLGGSAPLGYLKPLIRADVLGEVRYDETLRIGEDYDLILRLLLAGTSMAILPEPYYLYRRHSGSISHRLSVADLRAMLTSQVAMRAWLGALAPEVDRAFDQRAAQLSKGLAFERLVEALKARQFGKAASLLAGNPGLAPRLWRSFQEGRRRRGQPLRVPSAVGGVVLGQVTGRPVPPYVSIASEDWARARPRQVWRELAELGNGRPIDVTCADQAGRYAAGFIPLARVQERAGQAGREEVVK